ncbi:hypothetical protein D3C72_2130000 [compost metagenome]
MNWNGKVSTATALCASSHERWPLAGRKVKKSLKMRLCVMTPLTSATSMARAAMPTIHSPTLPACSS